MKDKIIFFSFLILISFFNACDVNDSLDNITESKTHTLVLQPNSNEGKDALVGSIPPTDTKNYGSYPTLEVISWTTGGVLNINRALIEFDLSSIPANATIDSSFLSLFFGSSINPLLDSHKGNNKMWIQRIVEPWDENSVTWVTQPKIDTKSTVWLEQFKNKKQNYENIDVTYLITDIIKSGNNYGFMIRLQNEFPYKATVIASSDHPDSATHPKLVVYYHSK